MKFELEMGGDIIVATLQDSLIDLLIEKKIITEEELDEIFNERLENLKEEISNLKENNPTNLSGFYYGPKGEA